MDELNFVRLFFQHTHTHTFKNKILFHGNLNRYFNENLSIKTRIYTYMYKILINIQKHYNITIRYISIISTRLFYNMYPNNTKDIT